ncbi:MAG TPA: dihydropteroate synthase [Thermoplasmata archaeon]|nr:dihydropteroate synthase [Thermoplasmata archaeon]
MARAVPEPLLWKHLTGEIPLDRTRVMGVLNVTPDSFSDGGRFLDPDVAILRALEMAEEEADLIDVGGESTRPGAEPVPPEEEWKRIGPVIEGIGRKLDVPISVDTRRYEIAQKGLRAGASIVNDVTGLGDPRMVEVIVRSGAGAVVMHMLGDPRSMQAHPTYADVVEEVRAFLDARIRAAVASRIPREAVAVDPGIGFGKTAVHNLDLLRRLDRIGSLGQPVVVGVSRKSFLAKLGAGDAVDERLSGSLAAATLAVAHGAHVIRAHDVLETVRAMRVADALGK